MKKVYLLSILFFGFILCSAQTIAEHNDYYLGSCTRAYFLPFENFDRCMYFAEIESTEIELTSFTTSSQIDFFFNENYNGSYFSSHGDYIEFEHAQRIHGSTYHYSITNQMTFLNRVRDFYGLYAFTIQNKTIYLVNLKDDSIVCVLATNFMRESDFKILVRDDSEIYDRFSPKIWLINNGIVRKFEDPFSNYASVKTPQKDEIDNSTSYKLEGIKVENPRHGVFIQDGKKKIVK